jgi:hypothetical protein
VHGKPLFVGVKTGPARDRPALHDAVEFEAKVVMQPPRRMFLNHIMIPGAPAFATPRLGGDPKLAFLSVQFEGHGASIRDA